MRAIGVLSLVLFGILGCCIYVVGFEKNQRFSKRYTGSLSVVLLVSGHLNHNLREQARSISLLTPHLHIVSIARYSPPCRIQREPRNEWTEWTLCTWSNDNVLALLQSISSKNALFFSWDAAHEENHVSRETLDVANLLAEKIVQTETAIGLSLTIDNNDVFHFPCYTYIHGVGFVKSYTVVRSNCAVCNVALVPFVANLPRLLQTFKANVDAEVHDSIYVLRLRNTDVAVCPEYSISASQVQLTAVKEDYMFTPTSFCGSEPITRTREAGLSVIQSIVRILNRSVDRFAYQLAFGTLLGAVKKGTLLMPWDNDADLFIGPKGFLPLRMSGPRFLRSYAAVMRPKLREYGIEFLEFGRYRAEIGVPGIVTVDLLLFDMRAPKIFHPRSLRRAREYLLPSRKLVLADGSQAWVPYNPGGACLLRTGHDLMYNPCKCDWEGREDKAGIQKPHYIQGCSEQKNARAANSDLKLIDKICKDCRTT